MKKQLILVVSARMDRNTKRNEDGLIRIGGKARRNLELSNQKEVELWPTNTTDDRINRSKLLEIYSAYKEDLKQLLSDGIPLEKRLRVGFVTTRTFNYICGNGADSDKDIWISDSIEDTVIGGDPEFILLTNGNKVKYAGTISGWGDRRLGSDGPLAELRPDPTIKVEDFVENIYNLLTKHESTKIIKNYKWLAGCCYRGDSDYDRRESWPIGGHIHIGTPRQISDKWYNNGELKYIYFRILQRALDELLAIPLMKLDDREESINRRKYYGSFGSFRTSYDRLEHRTLSGMWLAHPKLTLVTLGTAKAIVDSFCKALEANNYSKKYLKGNISDDGYLFSNCKDWTLSPILKDLGIHVKSSYQMCDILNNYNIKFNKTTINQIAKQLRGLSEYRKYSEYIDGLIELISIPSKELKINRNLKETWVNGEDFII